jgi:predicted GTPase
VSTGKTPKSGTQARRRLSLIASGAGILMGVVLPIAVLAGLGWLWLWERGYAIYWVFATLGLTAIGLLISLITIRSLEKEAPPIPREGMGPEPGAPGYTPREEAAWKAVQALAEEVDPKELKSREAVLSLGVKTVEAVARNIHPEAPDAIWRFTVPEALTLIERVSAKLKPMIAESIPLGDQLSVGQVLRIYRWRSAIDLASRAYDLWRMVRIMNPIAAATQEVRERITKSIYAGVQDELAKRLAAAYVREVGRAAIDLYGGRLRVDTAELESHISPETRSDVEKAQAPAEPLRILVGGQNGAGKSSLINALAGKVAVTVDVLPNADGFIPVQMSREGLPEMLLIDAPAPAAGDGSFDKLTAQAGAADLVIWVAGANRADRQADKAALAAIDTFFGTRRDRRAAPRLLVLTHIDQLRPAREWSPPYDLADATNPKARSIADATAAVAGDLGFETDDAIPVCLIDPPGLYNIDLVWAKIAEQIPEAKRARLVRIMAAARDGGINWRRVLGQAAGAGRLIAGALKHEIMRR